MTDNTMDLQTLLGKSPDVIAGEERRQISRRLVLAFRQIY